VVLIEDEPQIRRFLRPTLAGEGYRLVEAGTAEEGLLQVSTRQPDLVILDLGLPDLDGLEVLRRLRGRRSRIPVLALTARDALEDRVAGLDLGADDYLTKPFDLPEFEARVRALIRRGHYNASARVEHGRLSLDTAGRRLYCDEEPIELSLRELAVAEILILRAGRVVSKEQMVDHLYGWNDEEVGSNAIEVYVHRVRRKFEPAGVTIRTVRGMGYLLEKPDAG
jgi:two-component system OmpR family response regulator